MPRTYKDAGVDIDMEDATIAALVKELRYKRRDFGFPIDLKGFFTGLLDFGEYALSLCTDGVGTKLLVANAMRKWDTVGIDCVAMNVNDMICVGAEPLAFVDYFAVEKYDLEVARQIGRGLNIGARMANVTVIGGEFATIPEIVKGFDLAGTCLGFVRKDRIIDGRNVKIGDAIIGLKSSGIHSNGFTLVRKILRSSGIGYDETLPGLRERVGPVLLKPTRIYVREILDLLSRHHIRGLAHITGGGLWNITRLKRGVEFRISDPIKPQAIFRALQELGGISDREMYQTFNMGMGFCIVAPREEADSIVQDLKGRVEAKIVGEVVAGKGVSVPDLGIKFQS